MSGTCNPITPDHHHYNCLIYESSVDQCWIAHSISTDQMGTGDCALAALVDLMKTVNQIYDLVRDQPDIEFLRGAPAKIKKQLDTAKPLPRELYDIAYKMVNGDWPTYIKVDIDPIPKRRHTQFKTEVQVFV